MSNSKRKKYKITMSFTVDASDDYADYDFMKHDFLQELSCCVNMPDEDSFEMTVEELNLN